MSKRTGSNLFKATQILLAAPLFVALACNVASAQDRADHGGDGSGGGSTLKGELIETYGGHSLQELPGYDQAVQRLTQLAPDFAKNRAAHMKTKIVYIIPTHFEQLPLVITALDFNAELPCYQTDQEIFCDGDRLNHKMNAHQQLNEFIHELVMDYKLTPRNSQYSNDGRAVSIGDLRAVVGVMIRPDATDVAVATILAQRGFGHYYPPSAIRDFQKQRLGAEQAALKNCYSGDRAGAKKFTFKDFPGVSIVDYLMITAYVFEESRNYGAGYNSARSSASSVASEWMTADDVYTQDEKNTDNWGQDKLRWPADQRDRWQYWNANQRLQLAFDGIICDSLYAKFNGVKPPPVRAR